MSERVLCQFFLRGRCQRENCEFTHEKPTATSADDDGSLASSGLPVPVCHLFLTGSCKAGTSCRFRHEKPEKPTVTSEASKDPEKSNETDSATSEAPVARKVKKEAGKIPMLETAYRENFQVGT